MSDKKTDEIFDMFLQESFDLFELLNKEMLKLEADPKNEETLYSIMRVIHSLKGSAGMLRFDRLQEICHKLEDFIETVRKRPENVNQEIIDFFLSGSDVLQGLFIRCVESRESVVDFLPTERNFMEQLDTINKGFLAGSLDLGDAVRELLEKTRTMLEAIEDFYDTGMVVRCMDNVRICLEKAGGGGPVGGAPTPLFFGKEETSKAFTALFALTEKAKKTTLGKEEAAEFFKTLEPLLTTAAGAIPDVKAAELIGEIRDSARLFVDLALDFDSLQGEYYQETLNNLKAFASTMKIVAPPPAARRAEPKAAAVDGDSVSSAATRAKTTVRIEDAKIDHFLDSVGEMIILGEVFNHLQKRLGVVTSDFGLVHEFKNANKAFAGHIFTLQRALMDVRRVEIRNITGNLTRLARDTAKKLDKRVRVELEGEDAVIDKSLLEDVRASIIHIVRNAVDHGVESPAERARLGKPEEGLIRVSAKNEGEQLIISITDDGHGIDPDQLRRHAVERGVLTEREAAELSDDEARRLIFRNGFSTAKDVSDVSGRGVGMSAALENTRKVGGSVHIDSVTGKRTTISLRVPLSVMLSVVDAFISRVGAERYAMPIRYILESFCPKERDFIQLRGQGECVLLRGETYRVERLEKRFNLPSTRKPDDYGICVLSQVENEKFCLLVDEIIEHQQIVIKSIDGLGRIPGILGGAAFGDGKIGVVLDIEAFARNATRSQPRRETSAPKAPSSAPVAAAISEAAPPRKDDDDDDARSGTVDDAIDAMADWLDHRKEVEVEEVIQPLSDPLSLEAMNALEQELRAVKDLRSAMVLSAIGAFADRLRELGTTFALRGVTDFADRITRQVDAFAVDQLPLTLTDFEEWVRASLDGRAKPA